MESCHFESWSAHPPAPLVAFSFWKLWLHPCSQQFWYVSILWFQTVYYWTLWVKNTSAWFWIHSYQVNHESVKIRPLLKFPATQYIGIQKTTTTTIVNIMIGQGLALATIYIKQNDYKFDLFLPENHLWSTMHNFVYIWCIRVRTAIFLGGYV